MGNKETVSVGEVNSVGVDVMRLRLTGVLNADKLNQTGSEQLKEFIVEDTKTRLERWISAHFMVEEAVPPQVEVVSEYVVLDYRYNKVGKYVCNLSAQMHGNVVRDVSATFSGLKCQESEN